MTGRALRVGMVDLDTTHPGKWVPLIRSLGHDVAGVFDSGAVHPRGYADSFETSFTFMDEAHTGRDEDVYYGRVTQDNGQMAWSSPIWVQRL